MLPCGSLNGVSTWDGQGTQELVPLVLLHHHRGDLSALSDHKFNIWIFRVFLILLYNLCVHWRVELCNTGWCDYCMLRTSFYKMRHQSVAHVGLEWRSYQGSFFICFQFHPQECGQQSHKQEMSQWNSWPTESGWVEENRLDLNSHNAVFFYFFSVLLQPVVFPDIGCGGFNIVQVQRFRNPKWMNMYSKNFFLLN